MFQFRFANIFFVPVEVFLSSVKGGSFLTKLITLAQILCTNADVLLKLPILTIQNIAYFVSRKHEKSNLFTFIMMQHTEKSEG